MTALARELPLVTLVTPVYNGGAYLRDCIESVLAQSYENWEYIIVNNCSTDDTLAIATAYAQRDPRIRVTDNVDFLPIIDNFNVAMTQVGASSQYCKPLMADDWLLPTCVERMVAAAMTHPAVGLVCCYAFDGQDVLWTGMRFSGPPSADVSYAPGRELARETLLTGRYIFGSPTSCLIRSDLIRRRQPFYPPDNLHSDYESCYALLREADFAFVHQVLAFNRVHKESHTAAVRELESVMLGTLTVLLKHGPEFLSAAEFERRRQERLNTYYRMLGRNVLRLREAAFWKFHERRLEQLGCRLELMRLARATFVELAYNVPHPLKAIAGAANWWRRALRRSVNWAAVPPAQRIR